jgi:hypothetical protein
MIAASIEKALESRRNVPFLLRDSMSAPGALPARSHLGVVRGDAASPPPHFER